MIETQFLKNGRMKGNYGMPKLSKFDQVYRNPHLGINPDNFHLRSFRERLKKVGDLSKLMSQNNDFSSILHYFT